MAIDKEASARQSRAADPAERERLGKAGRSVRRMQSFEAHVLIDKLATIRELHEVLDRIESRDTSATSVTLAPGLTLMLDGNASATQGGATGAKSGKSMVTAIKAELRDQIATITSDAQELMDKAGYELPESGPDADADQK